VLAECDGGADQQFLLRDYHFLVFGEKCLEGNGTWAGFVTCDQDNPSQWFQLGRYSSGAIMNCWCDRCYSTWECYSACPMSCASASGVAHGNGSAYLVIASDPSWFWTSSAAWATAWFGTPAPSEEPSTSDEARAPPEEPSTTNDDARAVPSVTDEPAFGTPAPSEEPSTSDEAQAPPEELSTTNDDARAVPSVTDEPAEQLEISQAEGGAGDVLLHFHLLAVMCAFTV